MFEVLDFRHCTEIIGAVGLCFISFYGCIVLNRHTICMRKAILNLEGGRKEADESPEEKDTPSRTKVQTYEER